LLSLLVSNGCSWFRVKSVQRLPKEAVPFPARTASQTELIERLNRFADATRTLNLTVLFELTAASVRPDQIENYRETKGFILLKKPNLIRIIGLAFNVTVFNMVSNGHDTSILIPSKNKFYHLLDNQRLEKVKIPVGDLRPQHIFQALAVEGLDVESKDCSVFVEEDQEGRRRFYILNVAKKDTAGILQLDRKIWFDRHDLNIVRQKVFGPAGRVESDVTYTDFKEVEGIPYPSDITFRRPQENYSLRIRVTKTRINEALADDKFVLTKPENVELVDLTEKSENS
jgi:outer membrane lipoprotein-sorting protein